MTPFQPLLPSKHLCQPDPTLLDDDPTLTNLLCRIHVASNALALGSESRVTSLVLFHRFMAHYMNLLWTQQHVTVVSPNKKLLLQKMIFNSMTHKRYLGTVAAACIFLGCKIENTPRRIRDVINMSHMLDFFGHHWGNFVEIVDNKNRIVCIVEAAAPPPLDEEYWEAKQRIVSTEQVLLRFLTFDVQITQPHRILIAALDDLFLATRQDLELFTGPSPLHRHVLKNAWKKINDALLHPPCSRIPVLHLVCASIQLSMNEYLTDSDTIEKEVVSKMMGRPWWNNLSIFPEDLEMAVKIVQQSHRQ